MNSVLYIVNPTANGGSALKTWEQFMSFFPNSISEENIRFTERTGHAREIAFSAKGYDVLAAVGGDGTTGEIVSGIMDRELPHPKLITVPAGTFNDISRNLGIVSLDDAVSALHTNHIQSVDVMKIDCLLNGLHSHRYSLAYCNAGFSANSMIHPWMKRILGTRLGYYLALALSIIIYRPPNMTIHWDGNEINDRIYRIQISNVERVSGGRIVIAPGACIGDGNFNITVYPDNGRFTFLFKMLPKGLKGEQIYFPGISYFSAKKIDVTADRPAILEIDGEIFGTTPITATLYPRALEVLTPRPY